VKHHGRDRDPELVEVVRRLAVVSRAADVALVPEGGDLGRRSPQSAGHYELPRDRGFALPVLDT